MDGLPEEFESEDIALEAIEEHQLPSGRWSRESSWMAS